MLHRGNLESLHQSMMPFKWRPFDLYNNVNIDTHPCTIGKQFKLISNDSNGKRTSHPSNGNRNDQKHTAQSYQIFDNCQPENSQSSNQSSDSSCNNQQTTNHFIADSDNINSINISLMSTIKLCEHYRKLFCQSDHNQINSKCERSQCKRSISDTLTSCSHSIDSDINCCCNTILWNLCRICLDAMSDGNGNKNTQKNSRPKHYLHRNQVNNNKNSNATTIDKNHSKLITTIKTRYDNSNYNFDSTANNFNNDDNSCNCSSSSGELNSFNENETNVGSKFNSK